MSKIVGLIKRLFVVNWKMKLIALIFAFILWSFVIADSNPSRTKIFQDVPVTYTAADELKQRGLTSTVPLNELLQSATVTAQAPASALQYLNENMLQVSVEPSTVTITVEEIVSSEIPVEVRFEGERNDSLYYGDPVIEPENVKVTGARSNVEEAAKAVCVIDLNTITGPTTASYSVNYEKADGTPLSGNLFTGGTSVIVELPVYPVKEVPVDAEAVKNTVTGLAGGYQVTGVTLDPRTVKIAGKQEELDKISSVTLEPVVLDNAAGDVSVEANIALPEGIVAAVPSKVQAQFAISQPEVEKVYAGKQVAYKNLGDRLEVQIDPAYVDISVYGTESAFESFSSSKLKPFVDLAGLGRGVHADIPIKFENEPDLGVRLSPSVATVTVTIS